MPPLWYSMDSISELSQIYATLDEFVYESAVAFITGTKDIETEWDDYQDELRAIGVERYLEITQEPTTAASSPSRRRPLRRSRGGSSGFATRCAQTRAGRNTVMMTAEQRYLFDLHGYLHLRNVLSAEELAPRGRRRSATSTRRPTNCRRGSASTAGATSTASPSTLRWSALPCTQ